VLILLVSIHGVSHRVNTGKQNKCHAHLLSTYFITNKFVSASKCDAAHERYRSCDSTVVKQANNYQLYFKNCVCI